MKALKRIFYKSQAAVIKIEGNIDFLQTARVRNSLESIDLTLTKILAVVVNSSGGSPVQCEIIANNLRKFRNETNIPVYTFADEKAISGGYYILSMGDKVFADTSSQLGGVGGSINLYNIEELVKKSKVKIDQFESYDDLMVKRFSILQDNITEETKDFAKELIKNSDEALKAHIQKTRNQAFSSKGADLRKIFTGEVFLGKEAVNYGLVDHLGSCDLVLYREFPEAKIVEASTITRREDLPRFSKDMIKFVTSEIFLLIVILYILDKVVEVWLLWIGYRAVVPEEDKNASKPEEKSAEVKNPAKSK